ncbi:receptor-transporting protein 3-like [Pelobates fuscus]|uniref:receptor-transporting protein 3-like n=1 Tax=Pelobates fuscus TaxID=191477 RepID=UPI002FE433EA
METWEKAFERVQDAELTQKYGHLWTLHINNTIDSELTSTQQQQGWKVYQTSSFGRFNCPSCRHSWESARVSLTFHYRLVASSSGEVRLRLFRQKCRTCRQNDMLTATFKGDNKHEVLTRLITKIKKNCYREVINNVSYSGASKITKPHEASLCEACILGRCNREA